MGAAVRDMEAQWLLMARVGDTTLRPASFVGPDDSLRHAARLMADSGVACVLVRYADHLGMLTGDDVRDALALHGHAPDEPVGPVCHDVPACIEASELLAGALMRMNRHHVARLVVTDAAGSPLGFLEQPDVLALLAGHSSAMSARIQKAGDATDLKAALAAMVEQITALHRSGIRPQQLGRLACDINAAIFTRVLELTFPPAALPHVCLIVMGSEGRGEQILPTDQDNALIIDDALDAESLRPSCAAFTEALIAIGYAACPGDIMVRNPVWALTETDFRRRVRDWVQRADNADVMNLAIFLDAAPVAGDAELFRRLKAYLFELIGGGDGFYARFASAIVAFQPPLGLLSRLRLQRSGEHAGSLDIKKSGIFQIVHGIRSFALEKGVVETATLERIARLAEIGTLQRRMGREVAEAFEFLSALRTRVGIEARAAGRVADTLVKPAELTDYDRDMLRDSLRVVMRFRELVKQHFRLEMLGF